MRKMGKYWTKTDCRMNWKSKKCISTSESLPFDGFVEAKIPVVSPIDNRMRERYFSLCFSPLIDCGQIFGTLISGSEVTDDVVGRRQTSLLISLSLKSAGGFQDLESTFASLQEILATDSVDFPFSQIFMAEKVDEKREENQRRTLKIFKREEKFNGTDLEKVITIDIEQDTTKTSFNEISETNLIEEEIKRCAKEGEVRLFSVSSLKLPKTSEGNGLYDLCAVPIFTSESSKRRLAMVLLLGLNPMRSVEDTFLSFIAMIAKEVGNILTGVKVREEERMRTEGLLALERARNQFFSNISHEFRTPLTLILGPLEDLLSKITVKSDKKQLSMIHSNALRLLKLVNVLLEFSRVETGKSGGSFEKVDVWDVTRELCLIFEPAFERAGIAFSKDLDVDDPNKEVWIDRTMWETIVVNLLSNALKYTLKGKVSVDLIPAEAGIELHVQDTGGGIAEEEKDKIFERFYRIENAVGRSHEGSGIGLSMVKELTKLHGGDVTVESQLGTGSCFIVKIPYGKHHLDPSKIKDAPNKPRQVNPERRMLEVLPSFAIEDMAASIEKNLNQDSSIGIKGEIEANKAKILLVDDSRDMRKHLRNLLDPYYLVTEAINGEEAIQILKQGFNPDLVITDVMMPKIDGFQLLRWIRQSNFKDIVVILLTARAGDYSRVEGLDLGADDYLVKPFSAEELLARTRSHLSLQNSRNKVREVLQLANHSKDFFLALLSHEMRTPLAPILLIIDEIMADNEFSPTLKSQLDMIKGNVKLEIQLIDDLLDLTKISKGKMAFNMTPLDGEKLITEVKFSIKQDLEAKKQTLSLEFKSLNSRIFADSMRLTQIVWNLLKNAIKFSGEGSQIKILTRSDESFWYVSVIDQGIGIESAALSTIFQPFEQGGENTHRKFGGLGLGLTICSSMAHLHQGDLTAHSEGVGKGSNFTLKIPLLTTQQMEIFNLENKGKNGTASLDVKDSLHENKILLVEDDRTTMTVMKRILTNRLKQNIRTAENVLDAKKMGDEYDFDILISDIGLPDGSGFEVVKYLKAIKTKPFKSIALSGFGMGEDISKSMENGFDLHLTKPVDIKKLQEAIESLQN
eukprot:TRINITY_DN4398_c0_g1_i2.p1 TRINITY_DN4398_c0_g1~~TRINITY_DN4398_c0_g1_i2.p1  ORF type:complete len:1083 (+),score=369.30 TRINITY_DN4398_c0_g1_i2:19-3267(+)